MKVSRWISSACVALVLLAGCATFTPPETPKQVAAMVEATREAAYNTIADMAGAGSINQGEFDWLMAKMRKADNAVKLANAAAQQGLPDTQMEQLRLAQAILREVMQEIARQQDPPPEPKVYFVPRVPGSPSAPVIV